MTPGTTYYLRAYASNSVGTGYGKVVTFATNSLTGTITDIEGNVYKYVTIGTQVWMAENLKTTKFNDGTAIPLVTDNIQWANINLTTPAYSWYNHDPAYKATYGALYNWDTVNSNKLCPTGWHVPSKVEWTTLTTNLGGESVAGGKLKETGTSHWSSPNTGATNETGFTAVPGGDRYVGASAGSFGYIGFTGYWWSSTEASTTFAFYWSMHYDESSLTKFEWYKRCGYSVRCLKD